MSLQSIDIFGFNSGVQVRNKKPFLLAQDAFQQLENAYVFREELRKREGLQLIGRYRRDITNQDFGVGSGVTPWVFNIYSQIVPAITGESNAYIIPGTVHIIQGVNPNNNWTDDGIGNLIPQTGGNTGIINYRTGDVSVITNDPAATATITFSYYPTLPAVGIPQREIAGINDEQNIWFDTKYAYIHDGSNFQEFLPADAATWSGTNSDFFWGTNYRGSEAQTRFFFVTNFVASAGSPMRYTDGSTWSTFQPILGGEQQSQVFTTSLASGSATYGPAFITSLPIVEGSVVITVSDNAGVEDDVVFRDTPKDGTLVSSGLNNGTINYATGQIDLVFNPVLPGSTTYTVAIEYSQAGTYLFTARVLIPYYGRLLALNTYEGTTVGSSQNFYNRCRFSQIGSPIQQDAWRSDVFGKGGFVDAPVNEDIINATFYKNTLIVRFERSTWRLQYLGEYGLPFIWERISSDFGSESTFAAILFDDGVLDVGDKAITGSSGGDVKRIDLQLPDTVYSFRNQDNGVKRVHGVRDFKKELVYWCYPEFSDLYNNQFYPNKTLVYNYRNNTFAFFRNNVTCFGSFQYPASITWDRNDVFWDNMNVLWDGEGQSKLPLVASANQHGFAHFYGYADVETSVDSTIDANDQESLAVTNVIVGTDVQLVIPDHNLQTDEFIYVTGLNYIIEGSVDPIVLSTQGSTTLNDQIYRIQFVDKDTIRLFLYDQTLKQFYTNFTVTNVGTYYGGGVVALFPRLSVITKDFNPIKMGIGQNIKTSYIDFLFDASVPSPINVKMRMNATINAAGEQTYDAQGNLIVGNTNVETSNSMRGWIDNVILSNPCVIVSKDHGLLNGYKISIADVKGTTQLNGNQYTVTFITTNSFSIGVDATAYTPYVSGGYWIQTQQQYYTLSAKYAWHRFFSTSFGQFLSVVLTYDDEQMSKISTHRQNFVLNAMTIWYRSGGRNIFGK